MLHDHDARLVDVLDGVDGLVDHGAHQQPPGDPGVLPGESTTVLEALVEALATHGLDVDGLLAKKLAAELLGD